MSFTEAIRSGFRKYFVFSGRASRSEFWYFVLFLMLCNVALAIVNSMLFGPTIEQSFTVTTNSNGETSQAMSTTEKYNGGILGNVFSLLTFVPLLALSWRRLHDVGKAGWIVLIPYAILIVVVGLIFLTSVEVPIDRSAIPEGIAFPETMPVPANGPMMAIGIIIVFAAFIWVFVLHVRDSQPGSNKYGPNPHEVTP